MPDNQPSTPDSAGVDRTATGAIADKAQTTVPAATTPQTSTTQTSTGQADQTSDDKPSLLNQDGKSLANQTAPTGTGAPDTYAAFAVPDGFVLDPEIAAEAGKLFKDRNLSQEQAQGLVDFYVNKASEAANAPYKVWHDMQQQWVNEVKNDPVIGPRINQVTTTISKAIDHVAKGNPKLAEGFRSAMDFTGAGNNPAFIKMFYAMAQMITEGQHVAGGGPSPAGQEKPGAGGTSAAAAMYPNLPRAGT